MSENDSAVRATTPRLHEALRDPASRYSGTFMFCDLVGSTHMKTVQPEASWVPQLGWVYDTITNVIGDVNPNADLKYLGDGVLVAMSSDDATKQVNAAIQIQEAITAATKPNGHAMGEVNLTLSIGIATGDVRRFQAPDGAIDHVGLVVDKAKRLCDLASPNAVLIDRATESAANMVKIRSRIGEATGRTSDEYAGHKQLVTLKGIPAQVEYYEIKWEMQLFGVKSGAVTDLVQTQVPSPPQMIKTEMPSTPKLAAPASLPESRTGQRSIGKVKAVNVERAFAFIIDAKTGEDLYLAKHAMAYPEDFNKLTRDDEVAFVVAASSAPGKSRRAVAALKVGELADGVLTALANGKPYGWITVTDDAGNKNMVYMAVDSTTAGFKPGMDLSFKVGGSLQGARALDVVLADETDPLVEGIDAA